jgi:hypothetical protein
MEADTICEVIKELVGPIDPVGDSSVDVHRYQNLLTIQRVVEWCIEEIREVAKNAGSHEASVNQIGATATKFIKSIKEIS